MDNDEIITQAKLKFVVDYFGLRMSFEKAPTANYKCPQCGAVMKGEDIAYIGILECLECGYEVLSKARPESVKMVRAR